MEFKAFSQDVEVNGRTVYSIVDGFRLIKSIPVRVLTEHGIGKKREDGSLVIGASDWYPQQLWLDAFKEISASLGESILLSIGMKIPENAEFPPWVIDIESAVRSVDIAYHMNHRRDGAIMFNPETGVLLEGIGHYGFQKVDGQNLILSRCDSPYPCAFDQGILLAMARKFQPRVRLLHEPNGCRSHGQEACTYRIKW